MVHLKFVFTPLALANAERPLQCADLQALEGKHGQAVAQLVLSLEETDKARILGMLWLDEGDLTDDEQVADLLEEYHALGLDELILSGYAHLEEAYWFGENVTPILRRRGLAGCAPGLTTRGAAT